MNRKKLEFIVFCMEVFRNEYGLTGKQVFKLFKEHDVASYLSDNYEILHTFGAEFLCEDIAELTGYSHGAASDVV